MKKTFFAVATIATMILASCTQEIVNDGKTSGPGTKPIAEGGMTAAAFQFNFNQLGTKAIAEFKPTGVTASDVNDARFAPGGDLCILVFNNATTALEYKAIVTTATHTALVPVADPVKRIFVVANLGDSTAVTPSSAEPVGHFVHPNLLVTNLGTLNTLATPTEAPLPVATPPVGFYTSMVVGTTRLSDFYAIAFKAGMPQTYDTDKTQDRTFSVLPLSTRVNPGTLGLAMSNTRAYTFTLTPNVLDTEAEDTVTPYTGSSGATSPTESGSEIYNRFLIKLDYLSAKARLVMDLPTINADPATMATISAPYYAIKNLAKFTSLTQNVVSGDGQSIYHNYPWQLTSVQSDFDPQIDQASNVNDYAGADGLGLSVPIANGPFIFVPENTNAFLRRGQASFYALNVTYKPAEIVHTVYWQTVPSPTSRCYYDDWDTCETATPPADLWDGDKYIYDALGVTIDNKTYHFFANLQAYADAIWYEGKTSNSGYTAAGALAALGNDPGTGWVWTTPYQNRIDDWTLKVFTDAQSWYRINIGVPTSSTTTKWGVWRGNAYTATITSIAGPGETQEEDLFKDPGDPVEAVTYINVTIEARGWNPVFQDDIEIK